MIERAVAAVLGQALDDGGQHFDARATRRRQQAFIQEQDKKLDSSWDWCQLKPDEIREILDFFIGEPPVDPFAVTLATGPP